MGPQQPQTPSIQVWTQTAMDATKALVAQEVTLLNNNLQTQYLQGFNNWSQAVIQGTIPNTNPPQPPTGYVALMGDDGWAYINKATVPVCAEPPIPAVPQPARTPSGVYIPAIGQSIDPPAGAPSYPNGQVFSFPTATGTVYFITETVGNPFSPTLTTTIWTRVAAPVTA
jgi:hypothetical protein